MEKAVKIVKLVTMVSMSQSFWRDVTLDPLVCKYK